ncbi:MAG TPA: 50S ribosomal protein L35, partial [Candidatus Lambdaproteobacteria bacterium]|nr:50S ribosomal protein L35 [Candidatus Lambdaproteobacteria bacterium]
RKRAFLRHGMRKRNQDTKRVLRKKAMVSAADSNSVDMMLPNG